jgi:hypothetical protein
MMFLDEDDAAAACVVDVDVESAEVDTTEDRRRQVVNNAKRKERGRNRL